MICNLGVLHETRILTCGLTCEYLTEGLVFILVVYHSTDSCPILYGLENDL